MVGPLVIPKLIQTTLRWTSEGSQKNNVLSWEYDGSSSGGPSVSDLVALATSLYGALSSTLHPIMGSGVNIDSVDAKWMGSLPHKLGTFVPAQPNPGTAAGELDPANAALVISWKTGFVGRSYRGRTYHGGFTENQSQGSTALSSLVTGVGALASALLIYAGTGAVPMHLVVASRHLLTLTDVTTPIVNAFIDSQRTRLIGRGS